MGAPFENIWKYANKKCILSTSTPGDRFMPIKVKNLIDLIENDGWVLVRQKGSHRQYHHPTKAGTVTVSGKQSVEVPPGTLNSVLKQAGLKK